MNSTNITETKTPYCQWDDVTHKARFHYVHGVYKSITVTTNACLLRSPYRIDNRKDAFATVRYTVRYISMKYVQSGFRVYIAISSKTRPLY